MSGSLSWLAPVASLGGSLLSGIFGMAGANQTNATNSAIAAQQIAAQKQGQSDAMAFAASQDYASQAYNSQMANQAQQWTEQNMSQAAQINAQSQTAAEAYNSQMAVQSQLWNEQNMAEAERFDTQTAKTQMDWQTLMSNTAYQRSVADMKAAGLNPILGVASGGASTPSGSAPTVSALGGPTASVGTPSVSNPAGTPGAGRPALGVGGISGASYNAVSPFGALAAGIKDAVNTAYQWTRLDQDIKQSDAQIGLTNAQAANVAAGLPGVTAESGAKAQFLGPQAAATLQNTLKQFGLTDAQTAAAVASANASYAAAGASSASAGLSSAQAEKIREAPPGTLPGTFSVGGSGIPWNSPGIQKGFDQLGRTLTDWIGRLSNSASSVQSKAGPDFSITNPVSPSFNAIPQ